MVDKVDRPESKPIYEIRESKGTHEDQHQQQNPREDAEKRYKEELEGKNWSKFENRSFIIRSIKIPVANISAMLLKNVMLHKGVGILHVTLLWKDGRKTPDALMKLSSMEEYIRFKRISAGQEIPRESWAKKHEIELGIPQYIAHSGPFPSGGISGMTDAGSAKSTTSPGLMTAMGIINRKTGKINWGAVIVYAAIVAAIIIGIMVNR
ncbi:MAG TPA: hypothetical protein PKU96_03555 [bacterium]|jgi:hypothetical protein|nr:hypothetical protein [Myxococcales bacterium]OQA58825.1 MAG: hypothetical protein BWY40_01385 [bacterium ADurb.Bin270]HPW45428.1 hypothetical protein [bacterium]HQC51061.1 hypothetical protein [bacterium]HQH80243.1 hypothetical protein [bacterium]